MSADPPHPLGTVQVPKRHVVEPRPVEHGRGHGVHTADPDVALGVARQPPAHEGVGHQHRGRRLEPAVPPGRPTPSSPPSPSRTRAIDVTARPTRAQRDARRVRVEIRHRVDQQPRPAVGVRNDDRGRRVQRTRLTASRSAEQVGPKQPDRGVVIAGRDDHTRQLAQPDQRGLQQRHRLQRRERGRARRRRRTASTFSDRTVSTRWSKNAAWADPRSTPCSVRPRCQSAVCRIRMLEPYEPPLTKPARRAGRRSARSDLGTPTARSPSRRSQPCHPRQRPPPPRHPSPPIRISSLSRTNPPRLHRPAPLRVTKTVLAHGRDRDGAR